MPILIDATLTFPGTKARIQCGARVLMHTGYLSEAELATAHLAQTDDISVFVAQALAAAGSDAWVCVLPEGPLTVPYLSASAA